MSPSLRDPDPGLADPRIKQAHGIREMALNFKEFFEGSLLQVVKKPGRSPEIRKIIPPIDVMRI